MSSLLNEIVVDTALETHAFLKKARSVCPLCGKHCTAKRASFASPPTSKLTQSDGSALGQDGAGAKGDGVKPDYYSNNPLFECLVCSRQVSSNRYATHLEKCMGMGLKAPRKNSTRTAKAASHVATRLLNSAGSDSPKKRTASPTPLRPSTEDKQARTVNAEDVSDSVKPGTTPEQQARGTPTGAPRNSPQTSATNDAARKASAEGPSTSANGTNADADALDEDASAMRTSDADGIDDADFPSAFSVSVRGRAHWAWRLTGSRTRTTTQTESLTARMGQLMQMTATTRKSRSSTWTTWTWRATTMTMGMTTKRTWTGTRSTRTTATTMCRDEHTLSLIHI